MLRILGKYCWLLLIVFLVSCTKKAEIGSVQSDYFVKYFGGSSSDKAMDMKLCADGGYALTGSITSGNVSQAFFIKTDQYGNVLSPSALLLASGYISCGNYLYQSSDGGFLVTGFTQTMGQAKDILIAKISAEGSLVWTKSFGGTNNDEGYSVSETSTGNILVGGYTESKGSGGKDAWGLVLDKDGNKIWDRTYGFSENDVGFSFVEEGDHLLLIGYTSGSSLFLAKIDKTSGLSSDFAYYGTTNDLSGVKSIILDNGDILVLANKLVSGISNIYALKLNDNSHQVLWEKNLTSVNSEIGFDIVMQNNGLIIVGASDDNQNSDFLIDVLDTNGQLLNANSNTLTAQGNQVAHACVVGKDGKIVFAGSNSIQGFSKISLVKTNMPE